MTPKQFGKLVDEYAAVKSRRLAVDKSAAALKATEAKLKEQLMTAMMEASLSAVGGATMRVELDQEPTMEPAVKDWNKLYAYILKTKDFSLLERRVGKAAVKEQWEAGKTLPGVEGFPVYKLHEHKV